MKKDGIDVRLVDYMLLVSKGSGHLQTTTSLGQEESMGSCHDFTPISGCIYGVCM
jgi:hypothetical protein